MIECDTVLTDRWCVVVVVVVVVVLNAYAPTEDKCDYSQNGFCKDL